MAVEDVMKYIATNEIKWIDLQFFDLFGTMHRVSISRNDLEESSFSKGISAADLSEVFGNSGQGELILLPDPESLARVPWENSSIRLICDVVVAITGERFVKDSRYAIERVETNIEALGMKECRVGTETEFYMFENATTERTAVGRGGGTLVDSRESPWSPSPLAYKKSGSFVSPPTDSLYPARIQLSDTLEEQFGIPVESHHHGRGQTGQQCVDITHKSLKGAADAFATLRLVAKNIALVGNAVASFMPYPVEGEKGSSCNIHQSLWKGSDTSLFYDASDEYAQMSQAARYYIGGLLEHAPALCLFTNPTANSYRRLAADQKVYGWGKGSSALVQVPYLKKNDRERKRISFTLADSSINPYLAFSAVVSAGLDGVKNKIEPGDPSEGETGKKKSGPNKPLPESLKGAVESLNSDIKFLKGVFSAELLGDYVEMKLEEHRNSTKSINRWEMDRYFSV